MKAGIRNYKKQVTKEVPHVNLSLEVPEAVELVRFLGDMPLPRPALIETLIETLTTAVDGVTQ